MVEYIAHSFIHIVKVVHIHLFNKLKLSNICVMYHATQSTV